MKDRLPLIAGVLLFAVALASMSLFSLTSTAMLFLFRLNARKNPAPAPSNRRVLSPLGGSTLITSAPRSARISPHAGPMTM